MLTLNEIKVSKLALKKIATDHNIEGDFKLKKSQAIKRN